MDKVLKLKILESFSKTTILQWCPMYTVNLGLATINVILPSPNLYDSGWFLDCGMGRGRIMYFIESQRLLGTYFENHLCIPLGYLYASKTICQIK